MTKLKTKKSILKRFKITSRGKILHRPVHQNHFNAKEGGGQTRHKRGFENLMPVDSRKIKKVVNM